MIQDTATITRGIKVLLGKAIREPMKGFAALGVAMMIDMKLSLIFLACAPAAGIMMAQLGGRMKRATKKSLLSWAAMLAKLEEIMRSLRIVKVYNRQEYESQRYAVINQRLLKQQLKIAKVDSATNPIMEIVSMAAIAAALIFGVRWVFSQKMEASAFFTLLIAICASAESFRKVSDIWNIIQQSNAAAERTFGLIDEPAEKEVADAVEIAPLRNSIVFKEIVFTYPGSERPVLKSINLSVQAGHNIAIVGANGSGKTTLVNLIPRFYDADSGNIYIDGVDITQASLSSLRDQIGLVSQNITIFNDTVAANIRYGNPDATMEEVVAAAKKSFAHEFIDPLENGYETVIGDSGTGLSGGQLQRLVIARAILKDPAILIFDEATSQVDADSESKIHAAIETFMKDRTSFVIAHRFSTVINSDIIVVMNEGNIIDQGPHRELFERCQIYKNLYETQLLKG